ncbi:hypothetical protein FREDWARD_102 [Mycobacterium phage Fredward]|nr:hypothetical protein V424_gp006 [Mycobacterium phage Fredward]AGY37049.1 hypothetical protein FREDWARD_102 [Mycobacterium phage Fredward]
MTPIQILPIELDERYFERHLSCLDTTPIARLRHPCYRGPVP